MGSQIDTSDIPEQPPAARPLKRDDDGRLPVRRSPIREAVARELERRKMTPYQLWKQAHAHCPTLSQPAVYEFLKGQRQIGVEYAEALMAALHLGVVVRVPRKPKAGSP